MNADAGCGGIWGAALAGGRGTRGMVDGTEAHGAGEFIDEGLYSRQLYVLGHEAMRRMQSSNVLVVGLKGLGVEIAKNVILAGVKSVTLHDPGRAEQGDLAAQYYLSEGDVRAGGARDACSRPWLAELNAYVPVRVLAVPDGTLSAERGDLDAFEVVVVTERSLQEQLALDAWCHAHGRVFIAADVRGLFGSVFCDFGPEFVVGDATGEPPASGLVTGITRDADAVVTGVEDVRHGLEEGDLVRFREVRGMAALNGGVRRVRVLSPFAFAIGDTAGLDAYAGGGVWEQVKQPVRCAFQPLRASLQAPVYVVTDYAKMERMPQLLLAFSVLADMAPGAWPRARHAADAAAFVDAVRAYAATHPLDGAVVTVDAALVGEFAQQARGYLAPMCAVLGGLVAQEVLKACSGKFRPVQQHLLFDSLESLPVDRAPAPAEYDGGGTRYDAQVAVFGRRFQRRLGGSRGFIVGSGAIGCELVKLYALMGVGVGVGVGGGDGVGGDSVGGDSVGGGDSVSTGTGTCACTEKCTCTGTGTTPTTATTTGQLTLTDMDNIEKSNLNRQFLFRAGDVGKPKSLTAAAAAHRINPQLRIDARVDRVGPESEGVFTRAFYAQLDFVTNALDNVEARKYMDQQCVLHGRPLLESGTLGTKGNTQVVVPHVTEAYSSSQDPPERTIPFCTLHNFPNTIEHTIEWAMDVFSGTFRADPEAANRFIAVQGEGGGVPGEFAGQRDRLEAVRRGLFEEATRDAESCVAWGVRRFQELFSSSIRQLLYNFPLNAVTSSGTAFWSGPKRAPTPIDFNADDALHLDFVEAAAHLRAFGYGVALGLGREELREVARGVALPAFVPRANVRIAQSDAEAAPEAAPAGSDAELEALGRALEALAAAQPEAVAPGATLRVAEFEKDDDSNRHIDFVVACANLRATNYGITNATRHAIKGIAGKIIPAIATTTALVAGLVALELYKVLDGPVRDPATGQYAPGDAAFARHWNVDRFKNGFVNLALPLLAFSSPVAAARLSYDGGRSSFSLWDAFHVRMSETGTLQALLARFRAEHGLTVSMVSCGSSMLYSSFLTKPERLLLPLDQLVALVTKRPLPEGADLLVLECLCEDAAGNDVETPVIKLALKE